MGAAFAFAVAHWVAEGITSYVLIFKLRVVYAEYSQGKLPGKFAFDLVVEAFYAVCTAVVVAVVQWLAHRWICRPAIGPARRHAWLIAVVLGAVFCWLRWGIWWLHRTVPFPYPERLDLSVAVALAAGLSLLIVRWRFPSS